MPATTVMMVVVMNATVASLRIHPEGSLHVFCAGGVYIFKKYGTTSKLQAPEG